MFIIIMIAIIVLLTVFCALIWSKQQRPDNSMQGYIVIPCTESTEQLELTVRSAYWSEMLEDRDKRRDILIVMINAKENEFIARRMEAELSGVQAIDISALRDKIMRDAEK